MKRFDDMPIYGLSSTANIMVACPNCGKAGIVTVNLEHNLVHFRCASCYFQSDISAKGRYTYEGFGQCTTL